MRQSKPNSAEPIIGDGTYGASERIGQGAGPILEWPDDPAAHPDTTAKTPRAPAGNTGRWRDDSACTNPARDATYSATCTARETPAANPATPARPFRSSPGQSGCFATVDRDENSRHRATGQLVWPAFVVRFDARPFFRAPQIHSIELAVLHPVWRP